MRHPRKDWTRLPAANANRVDRKALKGVAIHYNGPAVPASALRDPRSFLDGVRRYHMNTNGWSDIAYNVAVDQNGDRWVLRGYGHKSGANGDNDVNTRYLAIYCVIGKGQKPSKAMLRGVRQEVRRFRLRYPLATRIVGHRDIRAGGTECPGAALYLEVKRGTFRPLVRKPKPRPKPTPRPPVCLHCRVHCPKEKKA